MFHHLDVPQYAQRYWTGVIYNATVYSVLRATETVYLKAEKLQESRIRDLWFPLVVNAVFPLKQRTTQAYQRSLAFVDTALKKAAASESDGPNPNDWIRRILFPNKFYGQLQTELRTIPRRNLFDSQLNYEQAHAINSICVNDYGTMPYLISGPPGTGKTKTLVETAMQLLNAHTVDHLLICAPSDQAADTLALRLKYYLKPTQLLRLNGPWRADMEVPRELMGYTHMENEMFYLPPFKQLMAYNVVVTSCRDASILMDARLTNSDLWIIEHEMLSAFHPEHAGPPPGLHWGAILIDEAAQATELDVLSALSVGCPPPQHPNNMPQPRFVMAGDEKQLGPRTASRHPAFSRSLFARLFDRPLYREHPLSRSNVKSSSGPPVLKKSMLPFLYPPFTNLIRNYRSHPAILSVPSSLFYNDTLLPEAPIPDTPLQRSSLWKGRGWPVLFIPHKGMDELEWDGGGWYNNTEAECACFTAQFLVLHEGVQQSDICIMSPFAAQVKLLRNKIRYPPYKLWDVNIGPLEAFQGLEKRVVIICTTRSRPQFIQEDVKRGLGIVHFPRKMNVAITRAKEALVVIGNPEVLGEDEGWCEWMRFCGRNGLIKGDGGAEKGGQGKIGGLERALLAKEKGMGGEGGRVLGSSAVVLEQAVDGSYEAWLEGFREALDEEDDVEAGEEENENGPDA
ncbi:P-loop containing nucleoside triphosphate hydrolase protein [Byssothecium circinans]|uniref:P-loop containing nucleoside triphosphate hydrolase protein n=1 Tax=Byssothecium circinans TaxID=147558 RepID=A0A6A5TWB6_9PLEO|nr:P-loop containing nucleoside triphosphate hydrolase protein [Byssothecium circinans]